MRTSTSDARRAAARAKTTAASSCCARRCARIPMRVSVPQWIGTATRGSSRASDSAALSGSRCAVPQLRTPASDRQQRQVESAAQVSHPREDVSVACEVHALGAGDRVAERLRAPRQHPTPAVCGESSRHAQARCVQAVTDRELGHVLEAQPPCSPRRAARHDQTGPWRKHPQRSADRSGRDAGARSSTMSTSCTAPKWTAARPGDGANRPRRIPDPLARADRRARSIPSSVRRT